MRAKKGCKYCKYTSDDAFPETNEALMTYSIKFNGTEIGWSEVFIDLNEKYEPGLINLVCFGDVAYADHKSIKINYCPVCGHKLEKEELS